MVGKPVTQSGKQIFCPIDKEFDWANQRQKFPKIKAKPNIKDENHVGVEADIKLGHHKSVSAIIQMRTQSTAAKITKMFNKSSNTASKRFKQVCGMILITYDIFMTK